jgi:hypothetical protein
MAWMADLENCDVPHELGSTRPVFFYLPNDDPTNDDQLATKSLVCAAIEMDHDQVIKALTEKLAAAQLAKQQAVMRSDSDQVDEQVTSGSSPCLIAGGGDVESTSEVLKTWRMCT